jgi:hypothetical protein
VVTARDTGSSQPNVEVIGMVVVLAVAGFQKNVLFPGTVENGFLSRLMELARQSPMSG